MKYSLIPLFFLLVMPGTLRSQDFVEEKISGKISFREKYYNEISLGACSSLQSLMYGILQGPGSVAIPPLSLMADRRISRTFSLGAGLHAEEFKYRNLAGKTTLPSRVMIDKAMRFNAGIRLAYYPTTYLFSEESEKSQDLYLGARLGVGWFGPQLPDYARESLSFFFDLSKSPKLTTQVFCGYSRYFNQNWGFFSELALGSPYFFCAGLRYRK